MARFLIAPAETAHRVPLEVGQNDHRIGGKERLRNLDRSEMFQVDGHFLVALAGHAVGHDHRSVHDIGRKTVAIRRFQMIHGVMAGGLVERAGIRQERAAPVAFTQSTTCRTNVGCR